MQLNVNSREQLNFKRYLTYKKCLSKFTNFPTNKEFEEMEKEVNKLKPQNNPFYQSPLIGS